MLNKAVVQKLEYTWSPGDKGERLDKALSYHCNISRNQLQKWLETGHISCEGKPISPKHKPHVGQTFVITPPEVIPSNLIAEELPLEILYEDDDLLVVNKAPGQVVHPGAGNQRGTLVAAVLHHCKGQLSGIGGVERPGVVHRLDKDTSGALVFAKNDETHQSLSRQFANRQVSKVYLAWVLGRPKPEAGTWKWNIARHPVHRQKMQARDTGGRNAHTDYKTLEGGDKASLIELDLHTGRTHQIRVHAAAAGYPVVGDTTYGRTPLWHEDSKVQRQLLHAHRLRFIQPKTRIPVEVSAPVPDDFEEFKWYLNESQPRLRR